MTETRADPFAGLNTAQRSAVEHGERTPRGVDATPLLVIAGAGTGKTATLAHRVAWLVLAGVDPARILLLTFSRRAALEMHRRACGIVAAALRAPQGAAPEVRLPWSGTFHAIANRLLRSYAANLGLAPGFSVLDRGDAADLMDVARQDTGVARGHRRFPRKQTCLDIYSRVVNAQAELDDVLQSRFPFCAEWSDRLRTLFRRYTELKQATDVLDYDDLLLCWVHLMREPTLAADVAGRFDHVLVDEYQDTNRLQGEIIRRLRPDGRGVTVVGDDAQSIYAFRAADVGNILDFPTQYDPPARVVTLEQNYRSRSPVLDTANVLIGQGTRQYPKRLWSARGTGEAPAYVCVEDEHAQTDYVIAQVLAHREAGTLLRAQAVLFRNAHHSDALELELVRRNIPYVKYGGLKFLEAAHVKDLLALLRLAENPRDRIALYRVLQLLPGIGPATAERCYRHLSASDWRLTALSDFTPPPAAREDYATLCALMARLDVADTQAAWHPQVGLARAWYQPQLERLYDGAQARAGDLDQLEQAASRYPSRERFLSELVLDPPQATGDLSGAPLIDEDFLVLSTVHSAKGQEWDTVYVLNVADGHFPSEFATGSDALIDEERRLLYVAMTRARESLHLLAPLRHYVPGQARHGDRHVYGARSRFITPEVLATMRRVFHARDDAMSGNEGGGGRPTVTVDVAAKLRAQW